MVGFTQGNDRICPAGQEEQSPAWRQVTWREEARGEAAGLQSLHPVVLHTPFFSLSNISSHCAATPGSITLEAAGEKHLACVHPSQVHVPPACLTESVARRF